MFVVDFMIAPCKEMFNISTPVGRLALAWKAEGNNITDEYHFKTPV